MEHGDAIAEVCAEAGHRLWSEGDLRHEHDRRAAAPIDHVAEKLDVHECLARGRDPVKQERAR